MMGELADWNKMGGLKADEATIDDIGSLRGDINRTERSMT